MGDLLLNFDFGEETGVYASSSPSDSALPSPIEYQTCKSNNENDGTTKKRRRQEVRTCKACAQKHQKCDGLEPCSRCEKREVECEYPSQKFKPGPAPGKMKKLEETVSALQSQLAQAQQLNSQLQQMMALRSSNPNSLCQQRQITSFTSVPLRRYCFSTVQEYLDIYNDLIHMYGIKVPQVDIAAFLNGSATRNTQLIVSSALAHISLLCGNPDYGRDFFQRANKLTRDYAFEISADVAASHYLLSWSAFLQTEDTTNRLVLAMNITLRLLHKISLRSSRQAASPSSSSTSLSSPSDSSSSPSSSTSLSLVEGPSSIYDDDDKDTISAIYIASFILYADMLSSWTHVNKIYTKILQLSDKLSCLSTSVLIPYIRICEIWSRLYVNKDEGTARELLDFVHGFSFKNTGLSLRLQSLGSAHITCCEAVAYFFLGDHQQAVMFADMTIGLLSNNRCESCLGLDLINICGQIHWYSGCLSSFQKDLVLLSKLEVSIPLAKSLREVLQCLPGSDFSKLNGRFADLRSTIHGSQCDLVEAWSSLSDCLLHSDSLIQPPTPNNMLSSIDDHLLNASVDFDGAFIELS